MPNPSPVSCADDGAGPFIAARTRKHRHVRVREARGFILVVGAGWQDKRQNGQRKAGQISSAMALDKDKTMTSKSGKHQIRKLK